MAVYWSTSFYGNRDLNSKSLCASKMDSPIIQVYTTRLQRFHFNIPLLSFVIWTIKIDHAERKLQNILGKKKRDDFEKNTTWHNKMFRKEKKLCLCILYTYD